MNPVADVLDGAADLIEVRGWCQKVLLTPEGRVCLYGSVLEAAGANLVGWDGDVSSLATDAMYAVNQHLRRQALACPIEWNDESGRTEFEVIDELRLTAKALREVDA